jgi:phosphate transport system substrate-binding protein
MKKILSTILCLGFAASLASAAIVAEGSTTVLPIAQKTAEVFMDNNPSADISIRGGGSGVGIKSLIADRCDIAMSSRPMKDAELQTAASKGINAKATLVALDAIAVVVNKNNPVKELSQTRVKDIFSGKITNWSQVGGENRAIVVVSRDSASGSFECFNELALKGVKLTKSAMMQASNQGVAQVVSTTPGAVGYVGLGYLNGVKALSIGGIFPSERTVLDKSFPYARPLYMYTNGAPKGETKKYIDFVISSAGQRLAKQLGFVAFN